jgi:agmatinase
MAKAVRLAFTGIATFGRAPHTRNLEGTGAEIAVLGIPFDEGVGYRPGTRFGPRALREFSLRYPYFDPDTQKRGFWDMDQRRWSLTNSHAVDMGDIEFGPMAVESLHKCIDEAVRHILSQNAFPLVLGGDHSITFPVVAAMADWGPLNIVHLDAHLDRRDSLGGTGFSHASPLKRISELPFVERIISIGLRGLRAPEDDYLEAEKRGDLLITCQSMRDKGLEATLAALPGLGRTYVTIDIDALDPAIAPGTGTPEADGLSFLEAKRILAAVAGKCNVVGLDLVEVNPYLDPSGRTALFGCQLIMEFLANIFDREGEQG